MAGPLRVGTRPGFGTAAELTGTAPCETPRAATLAKVRRGPRAPPAAGGDRREGARGEERLREARGVAAAGGVLPAGWFREAAVRAAGVASYRASLSTHARPGPEGAGPSGVTTRAAGRPEGLRAAY